MGRKKRAAADHATPSQQALRDQEVLRANRELAAYFKGRRTEREARAALKIIKAFVRDRERQEPKARGPLPGAAPAKTQADRPSTKKAPAKRHRARKVLAAVPINTAADRRRDDEPGSPPNGTE